MSSRQYDIVKKEFRLGGSSIHCSSGVQVTWPWTKQSPFWVLASYMLNIKGKKKSFLPWVSNRSLKTSKLMGAFNEAVKPILMEQIIIINAISLGEEMLTIERTCCFKGLPDCGNREIWRTEIWPRDRITNSFHLPFRVLMTINLPSFNRKTICLQDHVGKCGLFWLFVCINIISAMLHLLRWPKFNLSGGFTAHKV